MVGPPPRWELERIRETVDDPSENGRAEGRAWAAVVAEEAEVEPNDLVADGWNEVPTPRPNPVLGMLMALSTANACFGAPPFSACLKEAPT